MNSYFKPLVSELNEFWLGKEISVCGEASCYRTTILKVCCDLLAARKVCGFPSYIAAYGCSKCLFWSRSTVGSSPNVVKKVPCRVSTRDLKLISDFVDFLQALVRLDACIRHCVGVCT